MVDLFVARLPDECKSRLLAAEARAESSLRKKIRAYFEGKTPEDVVASKHQDALSLIRHFEEYAQAVLDAYAKELIPIKTELDEYLEELQDCAERFPDYMLPQKFITQDDIDYMIRNPGFTPGWAPSGYWEETFLACWNQLVGKGGIAFGGRAGYRFGSGIENRFSPDDPRFARIHETLLQLFPALRGVQITHRWGGALGVPRAWSPSVGFDRETGLAWLGGYVGQGVAAANLAGRTLAELIAGKDTERTGLAWVGRAPGAWEREPLRWIAVKGVTQVGESADRAEERGRRPRLRARLFDSFVGR